MHPWCYPGNNKLLLELDHAASYTFVDLLTRPIGISALRSVSQVPLTDNSVEQISHAASQSLRIALANLIGSEFTQKTGFYLCPGLIHILKRHRGKQQKAIIRYPASLHVTFDDTRRFMNWIGQAGVVWTDDQSIFRIVRNLNPRPTQIIHSRCTMSSSRSFCLAASI